MKQILFFLFIYSVITSCSTNNESNVSNENNITADVTVVGWKNNDVYQVNITNGTEATAFNLTEELGVPYSHFFLGRNFRPYLTFYNFSSNGGYKLWEKNIDTESHLILDGFCELDYNESSHYPISYDNLLFLLTLEPNETTPFFNVRMYNKNTEACEKLFIGLVDEGIQYSKYPIVVGNFLLIYHVNELRQTVVTKINISNFSIENQLIFDENASVTSDGNSLHVFPIIAEYDHYEYDFNTFELIQASNLPPIGSFGIGLFETSFLDNNMLVDIQGAQPSLSFHPALLDLTSHEVILDINGYDIKRNLEELIPNSAIYFPSRYRVDMVNQMIIGTFSVNNGIHGYGVYFANFEGEIINHVDIDVEPYDIIIR